MQLKPVKISRFSDYWEQNYPLVTHIFDECCIEKKIIDEKSILFKQNLPVKELILVHNGRVSIRYTAENGRRFQLGTIECDEQLFGEMEFFTNYHCQFDIIAEDALTISIINATKLQQALLNHPELALFFASAIALDYQDTLDIFLTRSLYPISYNIAYDLYQQHLKMQPVDNFDKNYLEAERFCTTDRVYRRAVKELIELDIVVKGGHGLMIKDLNKLKKYLESE